MFVFKGGETFYKRFRTL